MGSFPVLGDPSADGGTLYATGAGNTVDAISTTTLAQTAAYPVSGSPGSVAVQSGKIWVSYTTPDSQFSSIGDINIATSPPSFEPILPTAGYWP